MSASGKEAVVAILGSGDFFGEGCLTGQAIRMGTATAVVPTTLLVIEKKEMTLVLHEEHALADLFISYVLSRNIRIEEDLVDQLFNSTEKRLARTLLLLPVMANTITPLGWSPAYRKRRLRKWWVRHVLESTCS